MTTQQNGPAPAESGDAGSTAGERPFLELTGVVLDSADPPALADFYHRLLGWPYGAREPEWVTLRPPAGAGLSFQYESHWVPPVWPAGEDDPAMMVHLDIAVRELDPAVAFAERTGARLASFQPQDDVRVLLDPAGHPFCLFLDVPDTGTETRTQPDGDPLPDT